MIYINVSGRLTRDAELRDAGGTSVLGFGVASNDRVKGQDVTTFVDCSIWGKRGESLAPHLRKGTAVAVVGKFSTREHNGKTYVQCRVDELDLLGGGKGGGAAPEREPGRGDAYEPPDDGDVPFL